MSWCCTHTPVALLKELQLQRSWIYCTINHTVLKAYIMHWYPKFAINQPTLAGFALIFNQTERSNTPRPPSAHILVATCYSYLSLHDSHSWDTFSHLYMMNPIYQNSSLPLTHKCSTNKPWLSRAPSLHMQLLDSLLCKLKEKKSFSKGLSHF